jgi:hypothetical protein
MKLWEMFERDVEELKRQDEENTREMQAIINRCNNLLNELQQLDE